MQMIHRSLLQRRYAHYTTGMLHAGIPFHLKFCFSYIDFMNVQVEWSVLMCTLPYLRIKAKAIHYLVYVRFSGPFCWKPGGVKTKCKCMGAWL